jgi:hypothetical protein
MVADYNLAEEPSVGVLYPSDIADVEFLRVNIEELGSS